MKRILIFLLLIAATGAVAQDRFDQTWRRNPWNASLNAAGIRLDSISHSYAEAYFTKENGGMTSHSSSDNSWNAGVRTESIRHLKRVSFAGGFNYDYFDGRNMCGSMFTVPGYYPVDILEFTPGRKIRESYNFQAAMSAELNPHWLAGFDARFEARNYAKRKDLRHKNTRLDFEFAPGILYRAGRFAAGASYIVGIDNEKLEAEEIGSTPESYKAFFDRGLRYGSLQLWESNDLHLTTSGVSGFPVRETTQGAAVQAQYGPLFAEAAYRNRQGRTGEGGTIWHEFATDNFTADAVVTLGNSLSRHYVRLGMEWESLDNRENIITYETVNGVSTPHIHGSTPIFGRRSLDLNGEYEWKREQMDWRIGATYTQLNRESTLMYPCVKEQRMHWQTVWSTFLYRFGAWEATVAADFRKGSFSEKERVSEAPAAPGDYPSQLTEYYLYENEYLTAPRLGVGLAVRRNIRRFYVDLTARCEHGFDLQYVPQANRIAATLSVGYNF